MVMVESADALGARGPVVASGTTTRASAVPNVRSRLVIMVPPVCRDPSRVIVTNLSRPGEGGHDSARGPVGTDLGHLLWGRAASDAFLHLEDLVGDQAVRVAVHGVGGLGVGGLDEAEDLPLGLVDPVAQVADAVGLLGGEVGLVGLGDLVHR